VPSLGVMANWGEARIDFLKQSGVAIDLTYTDHEKYEL